MVENKPQVQTIRIVAQPKPEEGWLHRFRNLGEALWVRLRESCDVSIEEIDASSDHFHVRGIPPERATAVTDIVESMIQEHHLDDSVFVMPADSDRSPYIVVLVVDPAFGERLWEIAMSRDTWVVPSDVNKATVRGIWEACRERGGQPSVTFWSAPTPAVTEEDWLAMLDTIEVHHGDCWSVPSLDTLNVYGAALTPAISAALREYEYETVKSAALGFIAFKRNAA